ncbi:ArsR family transcriptional regulator [Spirillospora sp. NPDC029432]|uniref:ArsR family transcriptional regulator n=1 Tax=Spirillospora sp. NPDC029432 TaxID=3154599 RepID=UPI003454EB98
MLRIHFTADDLGRTRFLPEPAPMLELKLALVALRRADAVPRLDGWRRAALASLPESARPVWELGAGFSGALSTTAVCGDFDEALEIAWGLTPAGMRHEAGLWSGAGGRAAPSWARSVAAGDRDAVRYVMRGFRGAHAAILRPYWPEIRAGHHAELAHHGRVLARRGTAGMLAELVPGAAWRDGGLEIATPGRREVRLRGRGLALVPTAFWTGPPLVAESPDEPVLLVYPSRTRTVLRAGSGRDPLAGVLGPTRAAVLRLLARPTVTKDIARQVGISPASASEHAAALRAARLVTSRRDGRAVLHHATPLGLELINANGR